MVIWGCPTQSILNSNISWKNWKGRNYLSYPFFHSATSVYVCAHAFWPFRCVQILSNLPEDYAEYFHQHYKVVEKEFEAALNTIRAANNQKLYRYLAKTLSGAKNIYASA